MDDNIFHYILLAGVVLVFILCIVNLVYTIKEYKKEKYGGDLPKMNTKEGYFSGGGPYGTVKSGNGGFDAGRW